jgi:protein TonB
MLIWGLWKSQIRYAIEQTAPLFVSMITPSIPKEEPPPTPPIPKPVVSKPRIEPIPPKPQQIVTEVPIYNEAEFTAPAPDPEPIFVQPETVPEVSTVSVASEQISLPELAVTCPDRPPPVYPVWSKRMREQGAVVLQVFLDISGHVVRSEVNRSSGSPRLDEAATQAIQRWRCRPATKDGKPVSAVALQTINFVIN